MLFMSISDKQIGKNLARLRGDVSQQELADRMRNLGYKWSQATVWSIEKGERPLRLTEAEDVAEALGTFSSFLTQSEQLSVVQAAMRDVNHAHAALRDAIKTYLAAQEALTIQAQTNSEALKDTYYEEAVLDWLSTPVANVAYEVRVEADETEKAVAAASAIAASSRRGASSDANEAAVEAHVLQGKFVSAFLDNMPSDPNQGSASSNVLGSADTVEPSDSDDTIADTVGAADRIRDELGRLLIYKYGDLKSASAEVGIPYKTLYRAVTTNGQDRVQRIPLDTVIEITDALGISLAELHEQAVSGSDYALAAKTRSADRGEEYYE